MPTTGDAPSAVDLVGIVGDDIIQSGEYYADYYLRTTTEQDVALIKLMEISVGVESVYGCGSTCREFAIAAFNSIKSAGYGIAGAPPPKWTRPDNRSSEVSSGAQLLCPNSQ